MTVENERITALYRLARYEEGAGITDSQRLAVEKLKILAYAGDTDAIRAIEHLRRSYLHPFLREVLAA
jgi:hypothetical protein